MEQRHREGSQEEEKQPQNTQDDTISSARTCCSLIFPFPAVLSGQSSVQEGQKGTGHPPTGVTTLKPRNPLTFQGLEPQNLISELHNLRLSRVILQDKTSQGWIFALSCAQAPPEPGFDPNLRQWDTPREGQVGEQHSTCSPRRGEKIPQDSLWHLIFPAAEYE